MYGLDEIKKMNDDAYYQDVFDNCDDIIDLDALKYIHDELAVEIEKVDALIHKKNVELYELGIKKKRLVNRISKCIEMLFGQE